MTSYRQSMNQTLDLMYLMREVKILERELTDKELKRREEIAKDLPDDEFKDRYGKDWMSVKMATATKMAKAEELEMDDDDEEDDEDEKRERLKEKAGVSLAKKAKASGIPAGILRQVYNRGVAAWRTGHRPGTNPQQWGNARVNSFISKSKGTWGGADKDLAAKARGKKEEVELGESVVDKVKQVASKKQAMKIDGVMVDTFTASAISQIYDKVSDANKKKMDKLPITKLANLAMKMMQKNEFIPEGKMSQIDQMRKDGKSAEEIAKAMKMKVKDIKKIMGEQVELDEEMKYNFVVLDRLGKVVAFTSKESDAKVHAVRGHQKDSPSKGKGIVGRNSSSAYKLKKPMSQKKGDMMINKSFDIKPGDKKIFDKGFSVQEEVELGESVVDKVKQVASKKQAMKIDGVMVDTFTASAISQIYDKVSDANKKKMDKLPITKLANLAMKMMQKNEFIPEGKMSQIDQMRKDGKSAEEIAKAMKMKVKDIKKIMGEEVELDEDGHADVASAIRQCKTVMEDAQQIMAKLQTMSPEDSLPTWWTNKFAVASNSMNKMRDYIVNPLGEALDKEDEPTVKKIIGKLKGASKAHAGQAKDLEKAIKEQPEHEITVGGYTTKFFYMCGSAQTIMKKNANVEGAEEITKLQDDFYKLEKDVMDAGSATDGQKILARAMYNKIMKLAGEAGLADDIDDYMKMHLDSIEKGDPKPGFGRTDIKEDAVQTAKDRITKEKETDKKKHDKMMDRARIQQARQKNMETEEVHRKTVASMMEQSARADARRAMRRDPEMKQKRFSKDMSATDDDKKAASKNIMVQMRKAQSLKGKFEVEFADGKKVRIPEKVAVAVQQKFNAMRKPTDKEKFQSKVAKSYKDMLRALKEGFASDAQRRAAFAQGYKAKGKKNKKESVLDRIDNKLKEIKNG